MDCAFYVYAHRRLDTGQIFYIGKGCGNRAHKPHGRSELWGRIALKYGFTVEILKDSLTETEAFTEEVAAISRHEGLCNFTNGGEGISGYVHTDETRQRLRDAHTGRKQNPEVVERRTAKLRGKKRSQEFGEAVRQRNLGRVASDETRAKMRAARLGRVLPRDVVEKVAAAHRGKKRSADACQKMRDSQPKRAVLCVETGVVFRSISEAAEWVRSIGFAKASKGAIWRRINSNTPGKTYGYSWSYHNV